MLTDEQIKALIEAENRGYRNGIETAATVARIWAGTNTTIEQEIRSLLQLEPPAKLLKTLLKKWLKSASDSNA